MSVKTPIAVVIFENSDDNTYDYRAFSPITYNYMTHEQCYEEFLARLYSFIGHNQNEPLNNATTYGLLKEVVVILSDTPVDKRGNLITIPLVNNITTAYKTVNTSNRWYCEFEGGSSKDEIDEYKTIPHTTFQ
jgi:hypothetical protein